MTGSTKDENAGSWLTKERVIAGVVGAIFGAAVEHIFVGQGATVVAALLFGIAGAFVPSFLE